MKLNSPPSIRALRAFSLIEVALAVGIFAFVGVALVGLFSVGLRSNRESVDELEATHLAQSLLGMRRAAPRVALASNPIPPLDASQEINKSNPIFLAADGSQVASANLARFGCIYRIVAPNPALAGTTSRVYFCLFWPPQAKPDNSLGHYEVATTFTLP